MNKAPTFEKALLSHAGRAIDAVYWPQRGDTCHALAAFTVAMFYAQQHAQKPEPMFWRTQAHQHFKIETRTR